MNTNIVKDSSKNGNASFFERSGSSPTSQRRNVLNESARPRISKPTRDVVGKKLSKFLTAFFPDSDEEIHIQTFPPKGAPTGEEQFRSFNFVVTREQLNSDAKLLQKMRKYNKSLGLAFIVNAGGTKVGDIKRYNAFFIDNDEGSLEEQLKHLQDAPLPPSIILKTFRGYHAYWLIEGSCSREEWEDIQKRLIVHFKADPKVRNSNRAMRLPYFDYVKHDESDGTDLTPTK